MPISSSSKDLYRVTFLLKNEKEPFEIIAKNVESSQFIGLVELSDFVFEDSKKHIILPDEDRTRKKFAKSNKLHIPYHNILLVEEFTAEPTSLENLPFMRNVPPEQ